MDFWRGLPVIGDETTEGEIMGLFAPDFGRPREFAKGYVERDYSVQPLETFAPPSEMHLFDESEWDARIDEQEATQSSLEHLYLGESMNSPSFVNLNQVSDGYCWGYSTGHAQMFCRLRDHQPLVRLNPHGPCAIIKGGRNEGGWCGLSGEWAGKHGYPVEGTGPGQWPFASRDLRYDTPACREQMKLHRTEEDWIDLTRPVHSRNLTQKAYATTLLCNNPTASDFSWWGHSVCAIRFVRIEAGSYGPIIVNSWKGWGRFGLAVLRGSKARPDGAISLRTVRASLT